MEDWETDEDGNFKMFQLHGYETATAPSQVLLRMLYFKPDTDMPTNTPDGLQLLANPDFIRKFAQDLIAAADQAEQSKDKG